jgi:hypothetical protein
MNETITQAFAIAGAWACIGSVGTLLGIMGEKLITKHLNATRRSLGLG